MHEIMSDLVVDYAARVSTKSGANQGPWQVDYNKGVAVNGYVMLPGSKRRLTYTSYRAWPSTPGVATHTEKQYDMSPAISGSSTVNYYLQAEGRASLVFTLDQFWPFFANRTLVVYITFDYTPVTGVPVRDADWEYTLDVGQAMLTSVVLYTQRLGTFGGVYTYLMKLVGTALGGTTASIKLGYRFFGDLTAPGIERWSNAFSGVVNISTHDAEGILVGHPFPD